MPAGINPIGVQETVQTIERLGCSHIAYSMAMTADV